MVGGRALADARIQEVLLVAKILRGCGTLSGDRRLLPLFVHLLCGVGDAWVCSLLSRSYLFLIYHNHRIERGVWAAGLVIGEPLKQRCICCHCDQHCFILQSSYFGGTAMIADYV